MKLNRLALISAVALVALLAGAIAFNALAPPQELKLKVKWRPPNYMLGNPAPDPWIAEIFFAPSRPLEQIDPNTLLLEGIYSPSGTPYLLRSSPDRMAVPFDGDDVLRALLTKAPHLAPGEYRILLQITGNLKPEYGATPFSGDGGINLIVPDVPPP
ncbi:MAG TPA: hypothetical protein VJ249_02760 [Candidatus Bathyarchaeia archaeon]|nr:hypothetical protein [Candidatus Bathyarchaeia archaeon]